MDRYILTKPPRPPFQNEISKQSSEIFFGKQQRQARGGKFNKVDQFVNANQSQRYFQMKCQPKVHYCPEN